MGKWFSRILLALLTAALLTAALLAGAVPGAAYAAGSGPSFTEEEQAYIDSCGPLRVGFVQDRIPVTFADENGQFAGISRYILDRVASLSGLEFEYVALPTGPVTYEYLQQEQLALVTSVEYNEANKKANGILISEPYLSSRKVIVARSDTDFSRSAQFKAALSSGSQTIRTVLGGLFPSFELVDYDSTAACFSAVDRGEADVTIQNQYVAEYWMAKPSYDGLQVIPLMGLDDQMCFSAVVAFGGGEGTDPAQGQLLIDILDKTIASISEDEVSSYIIRGVMDNQYSFTVGDFLYRYRHMAVVLAAAALVIVALAALLVRQRVRSLADRADAKARGEFLSTMSHEIRTPLNGLIGLNYLMGQNLDQPEKLAGYLRQSDSAARYLLGLVSDILDLSRLQERRLQLERRPVDLEHLTATVSAIVRGPMEEKGVDFQTKFLLAQPWVLGDEVRIQQVLLNLLDNARKFTPAGGHVAFRVEQTVREDGSVLTRTEVTDTGRGMSEEFQKHIFESFARELDTVSKGNEGTGLGLPICRQLAQMMGGELTFTSEKDKGSSFVFAFPAQAAEAPGDSSQPRVHDRQTKPRVLVAEDNELNGEIMLELLEGADVQADLAKNGRQALEAFRASAPGTYGVVLMDLLMPEMDGFQAAAAIRALDRPDAGTVRIIACTANSFETDRSRALDSGMDDFIAKPVDIDELLEKLSG